MCLYENYPSMDEPGSQCDWSLWYPALGESQGTNGQVDGHSQG